MEIKAMIEVLQAYERGERVDVLLDGYAKVWGEWGGKVLHMDVTYRIAPKQMTLVEELRSHEGKAFWDVQKRAADRIEELEEILNENVYRIDNDLLMSILKKRLRK